MSSSYIILPQASLGCEGKPQTMRAVEGCNYVQICGVHTRTRSFSLSLAKICEVKIKMHFCSCTLK